MEMESRKSQGETILPCSRNNDQAAKTQKQSKQNQKKKRNKISKALHP